MTAIRRIERHRAFQIIVSGGIVGSLLLAWADPAYSLHSTMASALASLIWLWE